MSQVHDLLNLSLLRMVFYDICLQIAVVCGGNARAARQMILG